jgi:hypothetical protein
MSIANEVCRTPYEDCTFHAPEWDSCPVPGSHWKTEAGHLRDDIDRDKTQQKTGDKEDKDYNLKDRPSSLLPFGIHLGTALQ